MIQTGNTRGTLGKGHSHEPYGLCVWVCELLVCLICWIPFTQHIMRKTSLFHLHEIPACRMQMLMYTLVEEDPTNPTVTFYFFWFWISKEKGQSPCLNPYYYFALLSLFVYLWPWVCDRPVFILFSACQW